MKASVELTITAAVEADALLASRRGGNGGGPVAAGVAATRGEAGYVGGLGDQLGGGQSATPLEFEQAGCQPGGYSSDASLEGVDLGGQVPNRCQQLAGELGDQALMLGYHIANRLPGRGVDELAGWNAVAGRELVQLPAKSVDVSSPVGDQVVAVVDQ